MCIALLTFLSSTLNANAVCVVYYVHSNTNVSTAFHFCVKVLVAWENTTFSSSLTRDYITANINEIDVDTKDTKDKCAEAKNECNQIQCPYGKEQYVDSQDCERCLCVDPCRTKICPDGTQCTITLVQEETEDKYKAVCRPSRLRC